MKKLYIVLLVSLLLIFAGCSTSELKNEIDLEGTPKVESMLVAFNEGNYAGFSKDFGPLMQGAMTEENFIGVLRPTITEIIGEYEEGTLTLEKVTKQEHEGVSYISAIYKGTFTDEDGDVAVTIWFTDDDDMKIETLILNSPKLVNIYG
ncbi:DUF3887 domain-containing protein [Alkalibacter mobilis]|uniref:DUF3887 domain-containing protein n=1 Tax=Alkalibacter mobilis TaxID=2787712 RepID=UPI00189C8A18|nr:DUF3887 domain-containing protein [Alkalibacter mobilis]MBF7097267.1 hypothetical protein [Alkalibacter mobilis]